MSQPPPPVGSTPDPPPPPPTGDQQPPADVRQDAPHDAPHDDPLRGSRTSGAWAGLIVAAVLLVLLVIFVIQNTESVPVEFLGFDGDAPLAAALLIATVVGMVIVGLVGSLRILQLRRRVKRDRR